MKLIYKVEDKPKLGSRLVFALQQLLAIMAATITVPAVVGNGMDPAAALFGAGVGTLVYLLFTKGKSPVFLGSSFTFIPSMAAAFAGAVSMQAGYLGLIIGAAIAGLVYCIISLIVKLVGVKWIDKLMPAVVIGPTVSIIGLGLAGNAVGDLTNKTSDAFVSYPYIICGLVTLLVTMLCSVYSKKIGRLIPFIIGIIAGYAVASGFTVYGNMNGIDALKLVDFSGMTSLYTNGISIKSFITIPELTFLTAWKGIKEIDVTYIITLLVAYAPVAFVAFAEHLADHKNLSSIVEKDLLREPGLSRTLLGDGVGSLAGAFFGGCPNTTYGESIACVAITKNASVSTISAAAIMTICASFIAPFVAFLKSIPSCVMGGVCVALYGFIAVSGLKMIQKVNLSDNKNLFVVSVILIAGLGGFSLSFGKITITVTACALILGIITNLILSKGKSEDDEAVAEAAEEIAINDAAPAQEAAQEATEAAETTEEAAETTEEVTEAAEEAAEAAEEATEAAQEAEKAE